MTPYSTEVERAMVTFFGSLREKDRRRYAAVEAAKLGPGGLAYLSRLLGIDSKTIRQGEADLQNLPDVPHLQDRDRVRAARVAVEELEAELLLLDDGFQHRRLARDIDLVLIDALEPFGLGQLLPRGLLREPLRSLRTFSERMPLTGTLSSTTGTLRSL